MDEVMTSRVPFHASVAPPEDEKVVSYSPAVYSGALWHAILPTLNYR